MIANDNWLPSLWRYLWWALRGRCLRCGRPRFHAGTTRCLMHSDREFRGGRDW
jgi:hypothetical protein